MRMYAKVNSTMDKLFSCFGTEHKRKLRKREGVRRKMVIVGDGACGKTCLVTRMTTGQFVDIGYIPTVFDTEVVNVSTNTEDVELVIYDTAGQEDYDRLRPFSYADVDVVIICFSLADQDSLTNVIENWSPEIRYFCGQVPVILVGNKRDLLDQKLSQDSQPQRSAQQHTKDVERESREQELLEGILCGHFAHQESSESAVRNLPDESQENISGHRRLSSTTNNGSLDVIGDEVPSPSDDELPETKDCTVKPRPLSSLYQHGFNSRRVNDIVTPVVRGQGLCAAKRIGAVAYFETSALSGQNVEDVLQATAKASVLGNKRAKKFKPFTQTLSSADLVGEVSSG